MVRHARASELEKLLSLSDCIFNLQCDGTFTIDKRGTGSDPTITTPFPAVTLSGADARAKTVVFASYPTQVINTFTDADLTLTDYKTGDLTVVARNSSGGASANAWELIHSSGVYAASSTAIAEMNNHFAGTPSPADQSACFRFLRLNPDKFDPLNSPILRKTFAPGGADTSDPNGLPKQIDIQIKALIAVQDPTTKLWKMAGMQPVPVDRCSMETCFRCITAWSNSTAAAG